MKSKVLSRSRQQQGQRFMLDNIILRLRNIPNWHPASFAANNCIGKKRNWFHDDVRLCIVCDEEKIVHIRHHTSYAVLLYLLQFHFEFVFHFFSSRARSREMSNSESSFERVSQLTAGISNRERKKKVSTADYFGPLSRQREIKAKAMIADRRLIVSESDICLLAWSGDHNERAAND